MLEALKRDAGPPLFYLLEKPFVHLAERVSFDPVGRLLPFTAALALFAGAFALEQKGARLRFLLLLASSPLFVIYAAEARAYALLSLLSLVLFCLAVRGEQNVRRLIALAAVTALALYLHYLAFFVVAALFLIVALARRWQAATAILAGTALFLPWVPVLIRQPRAALAWVEEGIGRTLAGFFSALGGAGRVVPPLGGPLPPSLFALGVAVCAILLIPLFGAARADRETQAAILFVFLVLSGITLVSLRRPIAFAGRSEMAVLPVWFWAIARASEQSRLARWGVATASLLGAASSLFLFTAPRTAPPAARIVSALTGISRKTDLVVAGGDFYLPARLASDRGELRSTVTALPRSLADHPGWFGSEAPASADYTALRRAVAHAQSGQRIFLLIPSWLRTPLLAATLRERGSLREISFSPGISLIVWTLPQGQPAVETRPR